MEHRLSFDENNDAILITRSEFYERRKVIFFLNCVVFHHWNVIWSTDYHLMRIMMLILITRSEFYERRKVIFFLNCVVFHHWNVIWSTAYHLMRIMMLILITRSEFY